ncbi:MAG: hypothetical protein AB7J13_05760 [Pyrinomonadaceae bacterium]
MMSFLAALQVPQVLSPIPKSLLIGVLGMLFLLLASNTATAAIVLPEIITSDDQSTVTVNDAPEQEFIVIGKSIIVNKHAKGVLAVGGDVVVEGRVEGDVATVGGNVIQKKDAYIGGDIIVFGGSYKPESETPLRAEGKETVMFGVFEDELRSFGQNPSQIFVPAFSLSFVAQRLLLALFWFVVTMVITTIAPGAVSRAVARIHLSFLKVSALGAVAFLMVMAIIVGGVLTLPDYLSITLGMMGTILLLLGYLFGRVALQVSIGKIVQRNFLSENNRSETLAILIGVFGWTLLLSLPYIWVLALFMVFAVGIGLVLTGRAVPKWQNP